MVDSVQIRLDGEIVAREMEARVSNSRGGLKGVTFEGVSTDSRTTGEKELFFALMGDNFDGHDFVTDAVRRGARGVVIDQGQGRGRGRKVDVPQEVIILEVGDTLFALGELARWHRRNIGARGVKVVSITGSNGKTTTKEMTALIISQKYKVKKSQGNFNNLIGLPMMLFSGTDEDEIVVLEMGMNVPGEIERLTEIALPDIGVVTNIGPVHLEGVGSIEGVIREKGVLIRGLPVTGTAVLNRDCSHFQALLDSVHSNLMTFGLDNDADVRAVDIKERGGDGIVATILTPSGSFEVHLKVPGIHSLLNSLAATSVGEVLGVSPSDIKAGLEKARPFEMRMEMITTPDGVGVLNDSYNANPVSVKAALGFLASQVNPRAESGAGPIEARLIAVLGDMLELGDYAEEGHKEVGAEAANMGYSYLFLLGDHADDMASGAMEAGFEEESIFLFMTGEHERLLEDLKKVIGPSDMVLVKGSRGMKMERVVSGITSLDVTRDRR